MYAFNLSIGRLEELYANFRCSAAHSTFRSSPIWRTMTVTALDKGKGRARPEDLEDAEVAQENAGSAASSHSSDSDSDSDSDSSDDSSDSDSDSDSGEDVTPEFLESLLEKARQNARAKAATRPLANNGGEEEFIHLGSDDEEERNKKEPYVLRYLFLQLMDRHRLI